MARRIRDLTAEAADHRQAILVLVRAWRPDLLARAGVGPIPASSGQTVRVRLNRSGGRQLNQAPYAVVLTRLRFRDDGFLAGTGEDGAGAAGRRAVVAGLSRRSSLGVAATGHRVSPALRG